MLANAYTLSGIETNPAVVEATTTVKKNWDKKKLRKLVLGVFLFIFIYHSTI